MLAQVLVGLRQVITRQSSCQSMVEPPTIRVLASRVGFVERTAQKELKAERGSDCFPDVFRHADVLLVSLGEALRPKPAASLAQKLRMSPPGTESLLGRLAALAPQAPPPAGTPRAEAPMSPP